LDAGADINMQGGIYGNALAAAAYSGRIDNVELLLSKGADVNARGGGHNFDIVCAAFNDDKDVLTRLLSARLKEKACLPELVELFLTVAAEVRVQNRPMENVLRAVVASSSASSSVSKDVKKVIQDIWAQELTEWSERGARDTPLHNAARRGHLEIAKLLLDHGADPNLQGEASGYGTALHNAVVNWNAAMASILLEYGAAYYQIYRELDPELSLSASRGKMELAQVLINRYGGRYGTSVVQQDGKQKLITRSEGRWTREQFR
jgi:ankyrin repeat protein